MTPGFHTAGLLQHDIAVAIDELAHLGYSYVALRPHGGHLNPSTPWFGQQLLRIADAASKVHMRLVLDIDADFVNDAMSPRGPSLVAVEVSEQQAAQQWIVQWLGWARELGSQLITFSTGPADRSGIDSEEQTLERLAGQLTALIQQAQQQAVRLALRPRSGDAIATVAHYERLSQWMTDHDQLLLAADVGEMLAGGELPLADRLARNQDSLACVYLCDRKAGQKGDARIGHGDVALKRIVKALDDRGYNGPAIIRVQGHSQLGLVTAREAMSVFE